MEVQPYNFFFHPLYEDHSEEVKAVSVITSIALSILTAGVYLAVFTLVHLAERFCVWKNEEYVGNDALKDKQKNHLAKLKALADNSEWEHIRKHTSHKDSGFDWWMFPTDRRSSGYGPKYQVDSQSLSELKKDKEFIDSYREGVVLVAKSWGFDLENKKDVSSDEQKWVGYDVRLGKMLHSLKLFKQKDLYDKLIYFIDQNKMRPKLEKWIQKLIG